MKTKQSAGFFWFKKHLSWFVYGGITLLVLVLQMAPHGFPEVFHARPVPLVLLVVCVGVFEGARLGSAVGLLAGLLWDIYAFRVFGFDALILMVIGLTVGLLVEWLLRANFFSAMLLCASAVLIQGFMEWLLCHVLFQKAEVGVMLTHVYLPNALYTILLAPLMYFVVLAVARSLRRRTNNG